MSRNEHGVSRRGGKRVEISRCISEVGPPDWALKCFLWLDRQMGQLHVKEEKQLLSGPLRTWDRSAFS